MALIIDNTEIALESLTTRKLRTFLSVLGIVIGVAAVIIIGSISDSGRKIIFSELETFGLKSLWVWSYYNDQLGKDRKPGSGIVAEDVQAIVEECRFVKRVSPVVTKRGVLARNGNRGLRVKLLCVNSDYTLINNDVVTTGRRLFPNDIQYKNRSCLIGSEVEAQLFGRENPLGKTIKLGNYQFTVVGVLKRKDRAFISSIGGSGKDSVNGRVIIPISVYHLQYNTRDVSHLHVEAVGVSRAGDAAQEIKQVLKQHHKDRYNYKSETMQQYIEVAEKVLRTVSWIGSVAAVISLVVGGIGIMNIMTATVVERTREVGIRKALGATHADIIWQFLMESVCISLFGGIVGTVTGIGLIMSIEFFSRKPLFLSPQYILFAILVSFAVGIFFGISPAMRAAAMDPVDALRVE